MASNRVKDRPDLALERLSEIDWKDIRSIVLRVREAIDLLREWRDNQDKKR